MWIKTSRLYQKLIKEKQIFTEVGAYVLGSIDPGLIVVSGNLDKKFNMNDGEQAIWEVLEDLKLNGVKQHELDKLKNKMETQEKFSLMNILNIAMKLSFSELMCDANKINTDLEEYGKVTPEKMQELAKEIFVKENLSVLEYYSKKK